MLKLQQFYIIKLDSARLKEKNYNIKNLTINQARLNGELVQISNSQLIRSIHSLRNTTFSQYELEQLLDERSKLKRRKNGGGNKKRIAQLNSEIDNTLFIPEIISVEFKDRRHFLNILKKDGFFVNGVRYVPFMSSAGQIRRSSSLFVDATIKEKLNETLNNGRDEGCEIVPAKFSAYFALYSSSSIPVTFPKILVVSDLVIKAIRKVDYARYIDERTDPVIQESEVELEFNAFDGAGLMSPEYAKQLKYDLELDYVPSSAIVRSPFLKGLLVTFDFIEFAKSVANKWTITDIYGNEIDIRKVDVVVSQSMFKLWNAYLSTEAYIAKCLENNLDFGVAKVSPKNDKNHCRSSYQFLQVLNLSDAEIETLCKPTLDWIDSVSGGDFSQTLLFSLGETVFEKGWFNRLEPVTQALLLDNSLINDTYVVSHFEKALNKKKNDAKIGRLIFSGNYSFMIPDPYLYACHIFGIELKPLLMDGEHYSKYWNGKGVSKVTAIRSPIVHSSEVNILNLKQTEELDFWFKYITTGIIFPANGIGMDCVINGGSDFDGDLVATINHQSFIAGKVDGLPIVYETKKAQKILINKDTENAVIDSQVRQIKTNKIGFYTNVSSTLYALLFNFKEGTKEHSAILNRLKYGRVLQGLSIDAAKGLLVDPYPEYWSKWTRIKDAEGLSDDERERILFNNRIVATKRPYFMRWLYSHYNNIYRQELLKFDNISRAKWNIPFSELLTKSGLVDEQMNLVDRYEKRSFFINNGSTMNRITKYIEKRLSETKKKRIVERKPFDYRVLVSQRFKKPSRDDIDKMTLLYKEYKTLKRSMQMRYKDSYQGFAEGVSSEHDTIEQILSHINSKAYAVSSNSSDVVDIAIYCCYTILGVSSKTFLWQVFGREIVENLKSKRTDRTVRVPMKNKKGSLTYLWENFGNYLLNLDEE